MEVMLVSHSLKMEKKVSLQLTVWLQPLLCLTLEMWFLLSYSNQQKQRKQKNQTNKKEEGTTAAAAAAEEEKDNYNKDSQ